MDKSEIKMIKTVRLLWLGLLVIGIGLTVYGALILAGVCKGTKLCLFMGLLIGSRAVMQLVSFHRILKDSRDRTDDIRDKV